VGTRSSIVVLLVRGDALGTNLTGTVYEPDDEPPSYSGAPDTEAPYVWVCDGFYEVESGGTRDTRPSTKLSKVRRSIYRRSSRV